jgi:hypothetical protein
VKSALPARSPRRRRRALASRAGGPQDPRARFVAPAARRCPVSAARRCPVSAARRLAGAREAAGLDRKIDSPKRFKVLKAFASTAVLDQETSLVWEREPDLTTFDFRHAFEHCANRTIAQRGGWRLPTVYEIRSLIPFSLEALPAGHPFVVPNGFYWTGTTVPGTDTAAYISDFSGDIVNYISAAKTEALAAWCVRGGVAGSTD